MTVPFHPPFCCGDMVALQCRTNMVFLKLKISDITHGVLNMWSTPCQIIQRNINDKLFDFFWYLMELGMGGFS